MMQPVELYAIITGTCVCMFVTLIMSIALHFAWRVFWHDKDDDRDL